MTSGSCFIVRLLGGEEQIKKIAAVQLVAYSMDIFTHRLHAADIGCFHRFIFVRKCCCVKESRSFLVSGWWNRS